MDKRNKETREESFYYQFKLPRQTDFLRESKTFGNYIIPLARCAHDSRDKRVTKTPSLFCGNSYCAVVNSTRYQESIQLKPRTSTQVRGLYSSLPGVYGLSFEAGWHSTEPKLKENNGKSHFLAVAVSNKKSRQALNLSGIIVKC